MSGTDGTDGRKLLLGVKNLFDIDNVQDAFGVAEEYGDGKVYKIDYTKTQATTFPTEILYFYYIVLEKTGKVDEYAAKPWNLGPPNDDSASDKLGLLDGKSVNISSGTTVKTIAKKIIEPAFNSPTLFNKKDTKYADYISQTLFDDNDFELSKISTDAGSYPLLFFVSKKDNANRQQIMGVKNKGKIEKAYVILQPTQQFFVHCCVNNVTATTNDAEGSRNFCPSGYIDGGSACGTLMNDYCIKDSSNTSNYLNPVCGCYEDYINEKIIAENSQAVNDVLKDVGIDQLPAKCYASCRAGKAYISSDKDPCNVTICKSEINNSGVFNVDNFSSDQNCSSSSTSTDTENNTDNDTTNNDDNNDSNDDTENNTNNDDDMADGGEDKTLMYSLIIGGSVIGLMLIMLVIYLLM